MEQTQGAPEVATKNPSLKSASLWGKTLAIFAAGTAAVLVVIAAFVMTAGGPQRPETFGADSPLTKQAEAVVDAVSHGTYKAELTFKGPERGIVGVLSGPVSAPALPKVVVWLVDGKYFVAGPLFDMKGNNLSRKALETLSPGPGGAKIAAQALRATGFTMGTAGPVVLSFEDPNCMYCHKLSEEAKPLLAAGKLRIKVVPVGFLKGEESVDRAAAVLQSSNPAQAWEKNMDTFDSAHELGGIAPVKPSVASSVALHANLDLLESTGKLATPTLLYCLKGDKEPQVFHGIEQGQLDRVSGRLVAIKADGSCSTE